MKKVQRRATGTEIQAEDLARSKLSESLRRLFAVQIPAGCFQVHITGTDGKNHFEFFMHHADRIVFVDAGVVIDYKTCMVSVCIQRLGRDQGQPVHYYRWDDYTIDLGL